MKGKRPFVGQDLFSRSSFNSWDSTFLWRGHDSNSFLIGMESYHDNEKEDRKYSVFFQSSKIRDDWILTDCVMDIQVNVWDGDIDVVLHSNQVIAGNEYGYKSTYYKNLVILGADWAIRALLKFSAIFLKCFTFKEVFSYLNELNV